MPPCNHGRGTSKVRAASDAIVSERALIVRAMNSGPERKHIIRAVQQGTIHEDGSLSSPHDMGILTIPVAKIDKYHAPFKKGNEESPVVAHLFACSAKEILAGNMQRARHLYCKTAIDLQSHAFEAKDKQDVSAYNFVTLHAKVGTDRELIRYVAKRIPCGCLDEMAKAVKAYPKTGKCTFCKAEKPIKDQFQCGRCKMVYYCSRECQVAHWHKEDIGHKTQCNYYKIKNRADKAKADGGEGDQK